MIRKLLFVLLGCLFAGTAANAGNCRGAACRDTGFGKDANGCLEIRNSGREDIEITVYTSSSGPITVQIASGATEKVFKPGRICVPAADYVRSDVQVVGGVFSPSR
jgi:hypothetical protein